MTVLTESNKKWWVLIGVSIASFLGCVDFTIVNTALPAIQAGLSATVTQLQWIINIFILALSTFMVIMGRLADIYGRRLVLYIGMIVFCLSSLAAGLATNINGLIFFRLIQGISCSILYTASGAIVSNAFPVNERGKAIGALFGVNGIGLAMGPVLGGILVSALSWRWVFLVNVPLILISLMICFMSVHESRNREHGTKIDWLGLIMLMIALPCFVLGLAQGDAWGWDSAIIISLFAIAIFTFVLFYLIEMKNASPIIQFHLFANRLFITSIVATFSLALFYCLAFFLMPLYLHNICEKSGYMIGLMLLPTTAMVAILSPIVGKMTDVSGPKLLLIVGFVFFTLSAFLQTQFTENSSTLYILTAFALMGIGWACILGPSTVAALSAVSESMGAVAMGSSWTLHNIGGAIGLGVGVVIYRHFAANNLLQNLSGYQIKSDTWVNQVVMNPDHAIQLLQKYTVFNINETTVLFQQFFIHGYRAAMWFLVVASFISLLVMIIGMKKIIPNKN
jgi:EmrB/QacA subfamily drug resistance transporter